MSTVRTQQKTQRNKQKQVREEQQTQTPLLEHRESIIETLRDKGSLTRGEITTITGIPRTSVYDVLTRLLLSGVVEKLIDRDGRRGRPRIYYQLVA